MPSNCIVRNCKSGANEFVTFHRLPPINFKRQIWLNQLQLPLTSNGRVCSKHFLPSDFVLKGNSRTLNPNAFPQSVFVEEFVLPTCDEIKIEMSENETENNSMYDEHVPDFSNMNMGMDVDDVSAHVWIRGNDSIFKEHNYAATRQKKVNPCCNASETIERHQETIARLNEEMNNLRLELKTSKKENKKFANFSNLSEFQQELFLVLMKHYKKKSKPKQYSSILRQFAVALHYHSPEAYKFVRYLFNDCLPHSQTVLSWS